jgi:hypothetical protein
MKRIIPIQHKMSKDKRLEEKKKKKNWTLKLQSFSVIKMKESWNYKQEAYNTKTTVFRKTLFSTFFRC